MNILAKHILTLFCKISPRYQVVWAHCESKWTYICRTANGSRRLRTMTLGEENRIVTE